MRPKTLKKKVVLFTAQERYSLLDAYHIKTQGPSKTQANRAPLEGERQQGHRVTLVPIPTPVVEVEEALGRVDAQESGHILIVGEGGTKPNEPDVLLGHLNVSDGPSHQSFQDRTSVIVEKVDLILRNGKAANDVEDWRSAAPFLGVLAFCRCRLNIPNKEDKGLQAETPKETTHQEAPRK